MDDLVAHLSEGRHPVSASRVISARELYESIDRGYVIIKFTDTKGGTELGIRLDREQTNLTDVNRSNTTGIAHLVGYLTLNFIKVRCVVDLDIATLMGYGFLQLIDS